MSDSAMKDIIVGLVLTAVAGAVGVVYGAQLTQAREYLQPTCTNPTGLRPIPRADLNVTGIGTKNYPALAAIDGFGGSEWSPPMVTDTNAPDHHGINKFVPVFSSSPEQSTLTLTLSTPHDIKAVCITNGLGNGDERYENWGKVRTLHISPMPTTANKAPRCSPSPLIRAKRLNRQLPTSARSR